MTPLTLCLHKKKKKLQKLSWAEIEWHQKLEFFFSEKDNFLFVIGGIHGNKYKLEPSMSCYK